MSHKNRSKFQNPYTLRRREPGVQMDEQKKPVVTCPFCNPTHPLILGQETACGTTLQIEAVQIIYKSRYDKRMICAKCHKSGGDMIRFHDVFIHLENCSPDTFLLQPPKLSKMAQFVFKLKDGRIKNYIQSYTGVAVVVKEIKPDGEQTGQVLGYTFDRRKNVTSKQGERLQADPGKSIS